MMLLLSGSKSLCIYNPSIPHTTIIWQICYSTTGTRPTDFPPSAARPHCQQPAQPPQPTPNPHSAQPCWGNGWLLRDGEKQGWEVSSWLMHFRAPLVSPGSVGWRNVQLNHIVLLAQGWLRAGCGHQPFAYLKNNSRIGAELDPDQRPASLQSNLSICRKGTTTKTKQSLQASKTNPWIAATRSPAERTREQTSVPHVQL